MKSQNYWKIGSKIEDFKFYAQNERAGVKLVELSEFKVKNYLGSNQIAQFKFFDFMKIFTSYPLRGQNWPYFGPQQTHEK